MSDVLLLRWGAWQPQGPVQVDWSNPITRSLVGAWIFNVKNPLNLVGAPALQSVNNSPGNSSMYSGPGGFGLEWTLQNITVSNTLGTSGAASLAISTTANTTVWGMLRGFGAATTATCWTIDSATASHRWSISLPYSDGNYYFDFAGLTAGQTRLTGVAPGTTSYSVFAAVGSILVGTSQLMQLYQNGIQVATQTWTSASAAARVDANENFNLGGGASINLNSDLSATYFLWHFNRALSQQEASYITQYPYSILRPTPTLAGNLGRFSVKGAAASSGSGAMLLTGCGP